MTHPQYDAWSRGYGVIEHTPQTRERVEEMARHFPQTGDGPGFWEILAAGDRLASAAMWLTVHDTYAKNVYRDGRPLSLEDFKETPEGHTGSALNIIPAYVGYLMANAITGHTRGWIAEQGHAVSGIDCVNILVGNVSPAHERYTITDEGLTRFVRDFYNYRLGPDGTPESPRGSHVNAHTAGGIMEGGYLGFAGLQYVHLPLPGERLVAFLSDGAFEEQRGPDWAPRWWRREDCGLVAPFLINNGRRIDQRTTTSQQGGTQWLVQHLSLNSFDPIEIDGRDPAAYAWAVWEMERRLASSSGHYPVKLPYTIATTIKGYGFYGAGTNAAHNLPLGDKVDEEAAKRFNEHAKKLFVPPDELDKSRDLFSCHKNRPRERDHAMATRDVKLPHPPTPPSLPIGQKASPMSAIDQVFEETCRANPQIRPRVGNPDEMRSNRLDRTLDALKHRVTDPEPGVAEAIDGKVITALNEEAVACAALANKGGINLIHTYEAFGAKMHGAIRQEIIFARHCEQAGRPQRWLSIPVILTSHTYENGKNEQSHQDPALCESLLGEPADVSRVVFPADFNSAAATLAEVFSTRGQIWTIVIPKRVLPVTFSEGQARTLVLDGATAVSWPASPQVILTAIGAYQLLEAERAARHLTERGVACALVYILEPRRLAAPRDAREARMVAPTLVSKTLFPDTIPARVFVCHTRPEIMRGILHPLDTGGENTSFLGYRNHGGTMDVSGMMFANGQSWAHIVAEVCRVLGLPKGDFLSPPQEEALRGRVSPAGLIL